MKRKKKIPIQHMHTVE